MRDIGLARLPRERPSAIPTEYRSRQHGDPSMGAHDRLCEGWGSGIRVLRISHWALDRPRQRAELLGIGFASDLSETSYYDAHSETQLYS